jgi:hypothetical protein
MSQCLTCCRIEAEVRRELWHPTAAQLFEHSQRFLSSADAQEVTDHLEVDGCRRCLRLAALLREDRLLRRLASRIRLGVAGAARLLNDALESCAAGRDSLVLHVPPSDDFGSAARLRGLLDKLRPGPDLSDPSWSPFEDGKTSGRLVGDAGGSWLELAQRGLSPDGLLHALVGDARGRTFWQGFVMLCRRQPGDPARWARVRLPGPPPRKNTVRVVEADVRLLEGEDGEELRQSYRTSERDDPGTVPAWQAWARGALDRVGWDAGFRRWLEKIMTPEQAGDAAAPAPPRMPFLVLTFPDPLPHPEALAAQSDQPLHLASASADGRLQADLVEDGPRLLLEVRTKNPALNYALIRVTPGAADPRDPAAGRLMLLLRPDVNEWYAAHATFNTAELREDLQAGGRVRGLGLFISVVDPEWREGRDTGAVFDQVEGEREGPAGRAAWHAWLEHVERQRPISSAYLRELLEGVRARLGG